MSIPMRKKLGFSQEVYAFYLGISKGLLSLIELEKRNLRGSAFLKDSDLFLRWMEFRKTYEPPVANAAEVSKTREALESKLDDLKQEKNQRLHDKQTDNKMERIDYQMANVFLQQELILAGNPDDKSYIKLAIGANRKRFSKNLLLDSIEQSLADRFLDFQIAEYQRSLDELVG